MSTDLRTKFEQAGQGQVYRFYDELSPQEQDALDCQAAQIDLPDLERLVARLVAGGGDHASDKAPLGIAPAPYIPIVEHGGDPALWQEAREAGEQALRQGRVAAFTVAGGQGTRLGFDGPKGTFPVTPVAKKSLFQVFAEKIMAASLRYGKPIPWFVMTSIVNHDDTVEFFEKHSYFGFDPNDLRFFSQGLMPAADMAGKIILSGKGEIALSPDGHGGSFRALHRSGSTEMMRQRGIDLISYFQVDNPLVRCIDPAFIGFHIVNGAEMSSKACLKAYPEEKVGVFAERDGNLAVLEYSDLPAGLANETEPDGQLRYRAGSIAIHILSRDFVDKVAAPSHDSTQLPFHRADKKVPFLDDNGQIVKPGEPNGVKFEMFVFDALPLAKNPVTVETGREDDFSPVKNAEGVDSAESAAEDQLRQFARWARAAGKELATDDTGLPEFAFEISPLLADSQEEFVAKASTIQIEPGAVLEA